MPNIISASLTDCYIKVAYKSIYQIKFLQPRNHLVFEYGTYLHGFRKKAIHPGNFLYLTCSPWVTFPIFN